MKEESFLLEVVRRHEDEIVEDWMKQYESAGGPRDAALRPAGRELLAAIARGLGQSGTVDLREPEWQPAKDVLSRVAASQARRGASLGVAASFVLCLKYVMFARLRSDIDEARPVADEMWRATMLLDALCIYALESWRAALPGNAAAA